MIKIKSSNRSTEMKWNLWWLQIFRDSFSTSTKIESPKTQNILQIVKHSFALVLGSCNHRLPANSYHKILSFECVAKWYQMNSMELIPLCRLCFACIFIVYCIMYIYSSFKRSVVGCIATTIISLSTLPTVAKIPI